MSNITKVKPNLQSITAEIMRQVEDGIQKMAMPKFEPTGALEPVIPAVGNGEFRIVNLQCANKLGKTTIVANIFKNIFWEPDEEYFNFPAFKEWPFVNDDGKPIKRARIICTPANAAEGGPIDSEIKKWWPEGRYTRQKATKSYFSKYETDTGWFFDVMTFDQEPSEFEGPMISLQWCDEPPRPQLMGAIMSRFSKGGILLLSQTPVNAGPFLDVISDLKDRGTKVLEISATIFDNSKTDGKLNSKGTKRGLMTNEEIEDYVKSIPLDERESRLYGRAVGKSGKVYPMFDQVEHIRHFGLGDASTKLWNAYCIMDPHDKYYPFIQWWAVLPPNEIGKTKYVCYNEWPTYDTMGGYYDEKRHSVICNMTPEKISQVIKILDGTQYGLQIVKRGIDPRFARNSESNYTKNVEGLVLSYQNYDLNFELPDQKLMSNARDRIRTLMKYDKQMSTHIYNEPDLFIMPHCINTIRAFDRHYWEDGKDKESEEYKDPCDCARMFFALEANVGWKKTGITAKDKKKGLLQTDSIAFEFAEALKGVSLG
jgi:hypothetical protein